MTLRLGRDRPARRLVPPGQGRALGRRRAGVRRPRPAGREVLFAVDPAPAVVEEAEAWGADLVVVHHPLLLTPVHGVAATTPKGRVVHRLVRAGTALLTAHTNADLPADGVNESLARAVGIVDPQVVEAAPPAQRSTSWWCSSRTSTPTRFALRSLPAGAGSSATTTPARSRRRGRVASVRSTAPPVDRPGRRGRGRAGGRGSRRSSPRDPRRDVVAAMRAAHPYEEPAYDVLEFASVPGSPAGRRGRARATGSAPPAPRQPPARRTPPPRRGAPPSSPRRRPGAGAARRPSRPSLPARPRPRRPARSSEWRRRADGSGPPPST